MADIGVRVQLQNQQAVRQAQQFQRALRGVERQTQRTNRAFNGLTRQLETFRRLTVTGIGLVVARQLGQAAFAAANAADSVALLEARLVALGGTANTFQQTVDVANRLGVSFDTAGQSVARFLIAADEIGITAQEATELSETVLQLGRVAGLTQIELTQSTRQLAQGLSSGRLAGDELRSVLEGLPPVAIAIAEELDVGVGQLRALGAEGRITGDVIVRALRAVEEQAEDQFAQLPVTAERAFQEIANQFSLLVRDLRVNEIVVAVLQLVSGSLEGIRTLFGLTKSEAQETFEALSALTQESLRLERVIQRTRNENLRAIQERRAAELAPGRVERAGTLRDIEQQQRRQQIRETERLRQARERRERDEAISAEEELNKIRQRLAEESQQLRLDSLRGAAREIEQLEIDLQESLAQIREAGFNPQEEAALRERAVRDFNARILQVELEDNQRRVEQNQRLADEANERARRNREERNRILRRLEEERLEAERQLAEEQADFLEATLGTSLRGLFNALEEGENAWEAFADTAINAIQRIAQEILISGIINLLTGQPFLGGNSPLAGIFNPQGAAPLAASSGAPAAFGAAQTTTGGGSGRFALPGTSGPQSLAVTIRNEGTPQRISQVNQSAGSDPRQLVVNVITEDVARRGPIARSLEGNFGLSRG